MKRDILVFWVARRRLLLCLLGPFLQIQVQILTGRKIHLMIDPQYDNLIDIKKKIQIKEGIHPDQQILLLNGIRLNDGIASELHIEDGVCLFLTLRNRGG